MVILPVRAQAQDLADCPRGVVSETIEQMQVNVDEKDGISWYRDKSTPVKVSENAFFIYVGKRGCDTWLRLRVQYATEEPLTIRRVQIKADGKSFEFGESEFERDSDGQLTWQWGDVLVNSDHLLMLFSVIGAKQASLLLHGPNDRVQEVGITDAQKAAISNVLGAYHSLGGKL